MVKLEAFICGKYVELDGDFKEAYAELQRKGFGVHVSLTSNVPPMGTLSTELFYKERFIGSIRVFNNTLRRHTISECLLDGITIYVAPNDGTEIGGVDGNMTRETLDFYADVIRDVDDEAVDYNAIGMMCAESETDYYYISSKYNRVFKIVVDIMHVEET